MARVLVIDDDRSLLRALRVGLSASSHEVLTAESGELGISEAATKSPDVIVLDLGLPDIDGLTVCRRIRQWSDVPIVVLSATDLEVRKVAALDDGADDYVTKPFGMAELEARIRTAMRHRQVRAEDLELEHVAAGPLSMDLVHRQATIDDRSLDLTTREFDVLSYLARFAGKTCTHQMILHAVWGTSYSKEAQYLHAYIHRIRQKLGTDIAVEIKTVPGVGYVLLASD